MNKKGTFVVEECLTINADIEQVWKIMTDWDHYPDWNPFIRRVEHCARKDGTRELMKFHLEWHNGTKGSSMEEMVSATPPRDGRACLIYKYAAPVARLGLLRATRTQSLASNGTQTEYRTKEEFTGILAPFVPFEGVRKGFVAQMNALAEQASGQEGKKLLDLLADYSQRWPDEHEVIQRFTDFVQSGHQLQGKANPERHITASAWIVSPDRQQVLLVHHRKLGLWLQPGGHTDPGEDWAQAALREAREETGLAKVQMLLGGQLFDLDIHTIPGRPDTGAHLHYDLRFLVEANPDQPVEVSEESHAVRWVQLCELERWTTEESQFRMHRKCR